MAKLQGQQVAVIYGQNAAGDLIPITVDASGNLNVDSSVLGALVAGEAHVGEVGGRISRSSIIFNAHASASAYAPNDIVGSLTEIPNLVRVAGGQGYVTEIRLSTNKKSITPRFRVHFFNTSNPTVAADDANHKELYADTSKRMGYMDLPTMSTAADTANSDMSRAILSLGNSNTPKPLVAAVGSRSIWALLETLDAFTPVSQQEFTLVVVLESY